MGSGAGPGRPRPEHKRLGFYVGKWTVEGELKPGPMGPGGKFTSTDTCEWFDGGFAVVCRSEGRMPAGPARSIGILGYSAEEKVFKTRVVIREESPTVQRFTMAMQGPDGKWMTVM